MRLFFSKYQGTGNDFIMVDNRKQGFIPDEKIVKALCHRRTGVGADGLIIVEPHDTYDFSMRYFNADGHESTMCGNGGRCAIAFAYAEGICSKKPFFMAADGLHEGIIDGKLVHLKMQDVDKISKIDKGFFLDTGSPHFVVFTNGVKDFPVFQEGRKIRYRKEFAPRGTNVNFVEIINQTTLFNRTYERGVEEETLSCGTGSVAAALVFVYTRHNVSSPVTVLTQGGTLRIFFKAKEYGKFTDIWLQGFATAVFNGTITIPE